MITENPDGGGYKFTVSYHFESNMRAAGERSHPTRVKRLAQEAVTLSTALPLSYSSSVFVRCDADRLDIMKVFYPFHLFRMYAQHFNYHYVQIKGSVCLCVNA